MGNTRVVFLIFCFITVVSCGASTKSTVFKTIKTEHGDVYDCVDINKQPSLQHPALKDHKVQMRPPKEVALLTQRLRGGRNRIREAGSKVKMDPRKVCPFGHVPIRRPIIQNLTGPSTTHIQPHDDLSHERVQFAGLVVNGSQAFTGAAAYLGLYNPKVGPDQRSSSIVALISRDGNTFNQIEAGWTVNPSEYGDTKTRLYTSWTKDGYRSTGCLDTKCPGFIWISRTMPPGYVFQKVSKQNKYLVDTQVLIIQNILKDGTWWLIVEGETIGYWPKEIFTTMASGAQMVKFGGEISQRDPSKRRPEMGSGTFREGSEYTTAINRRVNVLNASAIPIYPYPSFTSKETNFYFVGDSYDRGGKDGYSFLYGGPYTPYCSEGYRGGDTIFCTRHAQSFLLILLPLFFL